MDLKCIDESKGGYYYRDHLICLGNYLFKFLATIVLMFWYLSFVRCFKLNMNPYLKFLC